MQAEKVPCTYFDGYPVSKMQRRIFIIVILGYLFDQIDNLNFGILGPALIKNFGATVQQIAYISSVYFLGMFIGGLLGGTLADRFGRKKTFLYSLFAFSLISFINAFATSVNFLAVCRFLTGIGLASMTVISISYIAEMTPCESRGRWQSLVLLVCSLGMPILTGFFKFIIPINHEAWRAVFVVGALGFLPGILGVFCLRESPRWLVSKGRYKEAEEIMRELVPGLTLDLSKEKETPKIKLSLQLAEIFGSKYIKYSILLIFAAIMFFPATFAFLNLAPALLVKKGFSLEAGLTLAWLGTVGSPIGFILATFLTDKGGRKIPLVVSYIIVGICSMTYGYVGNLNLIYASYMMFYACQGFLGSVLFAYIPENFSNRVRSTASGIVWAIARPATSLLQLLVPIIVLKYGNLILYIILGCFYLAGGIAIAIFGRRTAGLNLEELHRDTMKTATTR
ncbi:MFS transporter [Desulfitobacterium sp. AusDCA]|uniref:MFS transporter n=1 Tax=Desulfitobacterium sp. AusDCA TaxID=3240383 RepID=UPI003DA77D16